MKTSRKTIEIALKIAKIKIENKRLERESLNTELKPVIFIEGNDKYLEWKKQQNIKDN